MGQRFVVDSKEGCAMDLFVQPRAAQEAIVGRHGDALKVKVKAPPADGRANRATEELIARTLGIAPSGVRVVAGFTSRNKRVAVGGMNAQTVREKVALVLSSPAHERR